jgi:hypothetical protein
MAQGFLFAKPMPIGQLIGMMRARVTRVPAALATQSEATGNFVPKFSR